MKLIELQPDTFYNIFSCSTIIVLYYQKKLIYLGRIQCTHISCFFCRIGRNSEAFKTYLGFYVEITFIKIAVKNHKTKNIPKFIPIIPITVRTPMHLSPPTIYP